MSLCDKLVCQIYIVWWVSRFITTSLLFSRGFLCHNHWRTLQRFSNTKNICFSGAAYCKTSALKCFAARIAFLHRNGFYVFFRKLDQLHRILFRSVDLNLYLMEFLLVLQQPALNVFWLGILVGSFLHIKKNWVIPTITRGVFHCSCLSSQCEYFA